MATKKPRPDVAKDDQQPAQARALVDLPAHGVLAGCLLTAEAAAVAALVQAGMADDHPDAVAYAQTLDA